MNQINNKNMNKYHQEYKIINLIITIYSMNPTVTCYHSIMNVINKIYLNKNTKFNHFKIFKIVLKILNYRKFKMVYNV